MDVDKLSRSERVIAGAGSLLFLDAFLPWFRRCFPAAAVELCVSHNAWDNVLTLLAVLVAVGMVAHVVLTRLTAVELPPPGTLTWGQVHLAAGAIAGALVLLQLLLGDQAPGFDLRRTLGAFVGLLLAAGLAYGGYLRSQEPDPSSE